MNLKPLTPTISVSGQISPDDLAEAAASGFTTVLNNRPDGEEAGQPDNAALEAAARKAGLDYRHIPVSGMDIAESDIDAFARALDESGGAVLAFCRTGTRSAVLWALSQAAGHDADDLIGAAGKAGYDLTGLKDRLAERRRPQAAAGPDKEADAPLRHDIVIIGGGAGGVSVAASLLKRRPSLDIAIIEPGETHYYQPGWTLVGGGVFPQKATARDMARVMPEGVTWIRGAAAAFEPEKNQVTLADGRRAVYALLIAAPGLKLDWGQVEGLESTLGKNGVTSNYRFDLAPYTWELTETLGKGRALFTQPPMPIKCAGAPQKAMYLACDAWMRRGVLKDLNVEFHNAGAALFGVAAYVPALMEYVERYGIDLELGSNLVAVDGEKKIATFARAGADGAVTHQERSFDMLHVCPPQTAPDFIKASPLAGEGGWIAVSQETLQHVKYPNVFALGDACSAPNAKTAAAVRTQAPIVAENALAVMDGKTPRLAYNGYGSCPLTVERGKIVLAEFGYGGKLLPTFPEWLVKGTRPTRIAWFLKEKMLPAVYFEAMLKGREWLVKSEPLPDADTSPDKT